MTREEAIKLIQDDIRLHHDYLSGKYRKALNMAIESLSAEPCKSTDQNVADVPSGETISRADAIEAVRYLIYNRQEKGAKPFKWWFIKQRLNAIPSADAVDCTDFIMWLIEIVLDEEDWELNAVGYGEIIARKLKKLGLLEVKDGYYIRTPMYETISAEPSKSTDSNVADVPSGDLISRADAIEVGNKIVEELALSSLDWDDLKYWAKELFDALPSADRPQVNPNSAEEQIAETCDRPKGEWKWRRGGECSECGFHNTNFDFNFCPNCGADMKGGEMTKGDNE